MLKEPIQQFLQNTKAITITTNVAKEFHYKPNFQLQELLLNEDDTILSGDTYLSRITKLSSKMQKHVNTIFEETNYGELIEKLDCFTGEISSQSRIRNNKEKSF